MARVARRMVDMLRSWLSANSCNVAPFARRLVASFSCAGLREGGPPHVLSSRLGAAPAFGSTGADKIALHVRQPAKYRQHQAPGTGACVSPRLGQGPELPARIHDTLDDGEQIEGAARQPIDARHRHYIAGFEAVEHAQKLVPVGSRARHLLAVDVPAAASGGAELVKLRVEGLPIGADAGVADEVIFGISFGHILRQT